MRCILGLSTLPSLLVGVLAGCASTGDVRDDLTNDAAGTGGLDTPANPVDEAYSYFGITADTRRCPSPMCGGWFVTELNHAAMKCFDGYAASCYTPVLDWSEANLSEAQQAALLDASRRGDAGVGAVYAVVRGRLTPAGGAAGRRFVVTEGWLAQGETASSGMFVKVHDNGILCFTAPCPSLTEWALNMTASADIAAVDFAPARLSVAKVEECIEAMSADGLLVAGDRYTVYGTGGTADGRTATAAFYRLGDAVK